LFGASWLIFRVFLSFLEENERHINGYEAIERHRKGKKGQKSDGND